MHPTTSLLKKYPRYAYLEQENPGIERIPVELISDVFRFSYDVDDGWGPLEMQSVLMSLVAQVSSYLGLPIYAYEHCRATLWEE